MRMSLSDRELHNEFGIGSPEWVACCQWAESEGMDPNEIANVTLSGEGQVVVEFLDRFERRSVAVPPPFIRWPKVAS